MAQSARLMPVSEALVGVLDGAVVLTFTRIKGIADVHYAHSWPGRKPTHALEPNRDGKYSVTQLFQHRAAFSCIPRPVENDWHIGFDRPGRHAPPAFRNAYMVSNLQQFALECAGLW